MGIVFADRVLSGKPHRTGNITSWFLEKHLRRGGFGQDMLALITEAAGVTYTATSANFRSGALLKKIGWQLLEDTRLFWHHQDQTIPAEMTLRSGAAQLEGMLEAGDAQILADHQNLNLTPHLLSTPQGQNLFFITYVKRKGEESTQHYEVLHTNNPLLLANNIRSIANLLLPEQNAVLSSDKRFVSSAANADDRQLLQVPRYFKPFDNLPANQIDFLYGEVVLLDLKIY